MPGKIAPGLSRRLLRRGVPRELELLVGELLERLVRIDAAFGDLVLGDDAPPGFAPDHHLAPGVPRIRPLLVLLSAEVARKQSLGPTDPRRAEELAVVVELLHLAIAVHDAALGRQGGRRRRAARRLVGGAVGWLGGHHITLRALEMTRNEGPEVLGDLLDALREAAEGHALTQSLQGRPATASEAMSHAETHTGVVFSFACRAGARLSGAEPAIVGSLGRYGRHAGVAWHLAEDLSMLEQEDDERLLLIADRAASGRPMLPVCLAAERDAVVGALWTELTRSDDLDVVRRMLLLLEQSGAMEEGRQRLIQRSFRARRVLNTLPPSRYREAMDQLAVGLTR